MVKLLVFLLSTEALGLGTPLEKPRNTIYKQVGEGIRWHCSMLSQLGKPQLNKGSHIRNHICDSVVELLLLDMVFFFLPVANP